jgi:transposase
VFPPNAAAVFAPICANKSGSLLANVTGITVHDHWKPYSTFTAVMHALCNAHHLRELQALIDQCYGAILVEGCAFQEAQKPLVSAVVQAKRRGRPKRRTRHNLLLRLRERKPDVLRFLTDPSVPFTNTAERDGRMMKLRQKISGGFRSREGAADFAVIRKLIKVHCCPW